MNLKISTYSFPGLFVAVLFFSCASNTEKENQKNTDLASVNTPETASNLQPPSFTSEKLELKTFEVIDIATGKIGGWGYDIYIDGKRSIHQPILPGVSGNHSFSSEESAHKTGTFAINKMKQTGGLPTITIKELDSLGVTK